MENPHIEEVIRIRSERRGSGRDNTSPIRIIEQIFQKDGTFVMESDPAAMVLTPEKLDQIIEEIVKQGPWSTAQLTAANVRQMFVERGLSL